MSHTISGHCDLDLWPSFKNFFVQRKSLIFFEVGIPNLVCICILGWRSVINHFLGHCDLELWPSFNNNCVRSISLILFEIGIPNLVCECILGWWSVLYHLWVNVTLTSDLVLENCVPSITPYIIKGRNLKFGVWMQLLMAECHLPFGGHFDLDLLSSL